ncbi:hypothetical protein MP228_002029 [Amoeboaphelidium protococcarum]|nr:hypothetical protein MP228_002029 [Amoeboaphelidium protococcarum]
MFKRQSIAKDNDVVSIVVDDADSPSYIQNLNHDNSGNLSPSIIVSNEDFGNQNEFTVSAKDAASSADNVIQVVTEVKGKTNLLPLAKSQEVLRSNSTKSPRSRLSVSIIVNSQSDEHDIDAILTASPTQAATPPSRRLSFLRSRSHSSAAKLDSPALGFQSETLRGSPSQQSIASTSLKSGITSREQLPLAVKKSDSLRLRGSSLMVNGGTGSNQRGPSDEDQSTADPSKRSLSVFGLSLGSGQQSHSRLNPTSMLSLSTMSSAESSYTQGDTSSHAAAARPRKNQMAHKQSLTAEEIKYIMEMNAKMAPLESNQADVESTLKNIQSHIGKGIVSDIQKLGISLCLGTPTLSMYLLTFCIERNIHPLWFFLQDLRQYRQEFAGINNQSKRQKLAQKMYDLYLSEDNAFYVRQCLPLQYSGRDRTFSAMIKYIDDHLKQPTGSIFDDIEVLVFKYMEVLFGGRGLQQESSPAQSARSVEGKADVFLTSAQYQCLKSDLGDATVLTVDHFARSIQRLLDLPSQILIEFGEKIVNYLDSLQVDWKSYPNASVLSAAPTQSQLLGRRARKNSVSNQRPEGSFLSLAAHHAEQKLFGGGSSLAINQIGNGGANQSSSAYGHNTSDRDQHPFVKTQKQVKQFCEYCFKAFDISVSMSDASNCSYTCEICQYVAHKNCKGHVGISCVPCENYESNNDQLESMSLYGRIQQLSERYHLLAKEIQVCKDMITGFNKINAAQLSDSGFLKTPGKLGGAKSNVNLAQSTEIDKMERKKLYLGNEQHKVLIKLASLVCQLPKRDFQYTDQSSQAFDTVKSLGKLVEDLPNSIAIPISVDLDLMKNVQGKAAKNLVVAAHQEVGDVVKDFISKSSLPIDPFTCTLSFTATDGIPRELRQQDRPLMVKYLLPDSVFTLKEMQTTSLNKDSYVLADSQDNQAKLSGKRRAILDEFIDMESGYAKNLQDAVQKLLEPLRKSEVVPSLVLNGIFGNLGEIIPFHERIVSSLIAKKEKDPESATSQMVELFAVVSDTQFENAYIKYCSNQHSSQRTLSTLLKESDAFRSALKKNEQALKGSRLSVSDILIQPMHRITRYPILLRRLQASTPSSHPDFTVIQQTLDKIESIAHHINQVVHEKEAEYKLQQLQQGLDLNNLADNFELIADGRQFVGEKPVKYMKKSVMIDALLVILSDMLLLVQTGMKKDVATYVLQRSPIYFDRLMSLDAQSLNDSTSNKLAISLFSIDAYECTVHLLSMTDKLNLLKELWSNQVAFIASGQLRLHKRPLNFLEKASNESQQSLISSGEDDILYSLIKGNVVVKQSQNPNRRSQMSAKKTQRQSLSQIDDLVQSSSAYSAVRVGTLPRGDTSLNQSLDQKSVRSLASGDSTSNDTRSIDSHSTMSQTTQQSILSSYKNGGISSQQIFEQNQQKSQQKQQQQQADVTKVKSQKGGLIAEYLTANKLVRSLSISSKQRPDIQKSSSTNEN